MTSTIENTEATRGTFGKEIRPIKIEHRIEMKRLKDFSKPLMKSANDVNHFQFYSDYNQGDHKVAQKLGTLIKRTRKIKKVAIESVSEEFFTGKGLLCLSESLKYQRCLQHFYFNLYDCFGLSSEGLSHLGSGLKRLQFSLQKLELILTDMNSILPHGFNSLLYDLRRLRCLKELDLNLWGSRITDEVLETLSQSIKRLSQSQLENLSLVLSELRDITDLGLKKLVQCFHEESPIKSLRLYVWSCPQVTNTGIENFTQGLKRLKSLQDLKFWTSGCPGVTDVGLYSVCEALKELPALVSLDLCFTNLAWMTNIHLNNVSDRLKGLTLLKRLHLDFSGCSGITDLGLNDMFSTLENFAALENLYLNFNGCTDANLNHITEALKKMKSLESIRLIFASCPEITDASLSALVEELKHHLGSLKNVYLQFWGASKITEMSVGLIRQDLESMNLELGFNLSITNS